MSAERDSQARLVLFDIDGTLIRDGGASRDAYAVALEAVYGFESDLSPYDFSGRTDPEITRMVLGDSGLDEKEIAQRIPDLWRVYVDELGRRVNGRVRALPGIEALLHALSARSDIVLALLTGNIEQGARLKLGPVGLNRFFPIGAFGSDSAVRTELPPIALDRARRSSGREITPQGVVIIGDSIYDIRCGAPHGARTIAVASGLTSGALLRSENPDAFFDSLEATSEVIDAILKT